MIFLWQVFAAKSRFATHNKRQLASTIYELFADAAVPERIVADATPPIGLTQPERFLYERLLNELNGRLEQEVVSEEEVRKAISGWMTM